MIITCDKCSTSFNLDDFLVKEDGSKVRCSICKHVFTAYPIHPEPELTPETPPGTILESEPDDGNLFEASSGFEMEDSDLSLEKTELEIETPGLETSGSTSEASGLQMDETDFEESASADDDNLSFEGGELELEGDGESKDFELDENHLAFDNSDITFEDTGPEDTHEEEFDGIEFEPFDDEPASFEMEEDKPGIQMEDEADFQDMETGDVSFDEEPSEEKNEFELEFDIEDDTENSTPDDLDEESDVVPLEIETETEDSSLYLETDEIDDEAVAEDEPPEITPEDDFSGYDEVLEQETEPEDDSLEEETIEVEDTREEETPIEKKPLIEEPEPFADLTPRSRRKKKKSLVGGPVLFLLLILLLVFGAYVASIMTGYTIPYISEIRIPFIEQYLKKPAPEVSDAKPVPNEKSVNGRFVTNATAGTLFVITGRVENPSDISFSHIGIRGALITSGKVEAKTKDVYCGNIITEEMLKTGNISDINMLLAVKEGAHNSNVDIKPGASVPFMIVFSDLPEKLQNFNVKVEGFEKAK